MERPSRTWTLTEIATMFAGSLNGSPEIQISRPVPAGSNDPHGITFAESPEYYKKVEESQVGAVLVPMDAPELNIPTVRVQRPRECFGRMLALVHRDLPIEPGIHPTAVVSESATVAPTAKIGPYAVVEANAAIGDNARIYPFAYVGDGCEVGAGSVIFPHAVLYQDVRIGEKSVVHAGTIIGADGFGYSWDSAKRQYRVKVPQVGGVQIGSHVEIGALAAIDRATAGDTVLEDGVKIDNLVQIGHNGVIGEHTVIAGQLAMGGSSTVGKRCDVGGQTAISDHVNVTDDTILAGFTGVTKDIQEAGVYWGTPAIPFMKAKRVSALNQKLPELAKRIRDLEAKLEALEGKGS